MPRRKLLRNSVTLASLLAAPAFALTLGTSACSSSDDEAGQSEIDRYCDALCGKFEECSNPFAAQCDTQCRNNESDDTEDDCTVTKGEADTCIAAVDNLSCMDLSSGNFPPECDFCPDEPGADAGTGGGFDAGAGAFDAGGGGNLTGACRDLYDCCASVPAIARPSCEAAASLGNQASCQMSYDELCVGDAGVGGIDAGSAPVDAGAPAADAGTSDDLTGICRDLFDCCALAPPVAQPVCESTAITGPDAVCQTAYDQYCSMGGPDAGPPADGGGAAGSCTELAECCDGIADMTVKAGCEAVVSLAMEDSCASTLASFQSSMFCQ